MGLFDKKSVLWLPPEYGPREVEKVMHKRWWILVADPIDNPNGYALKGGTDDYATAIEASARIIKEPGKRALALFIHRNLGLVAIHEAIGNAIGHSQWPIGQGPLVRDIFIKSFVSAGSGSGFGRTPKDWRSPNPKTVINSIKLDEAGRPLDVLEKKYVENYGGRLEDLLP